jgi:hypothetical protein
MSVHKAGSMLPYLDAQSHAGLLPDSHDHPQVILANVRSLPAHLVMSYRSNVCSNHK